MKTLKNIFVFLVICSMTAVLYLGMKTELSPEKINYGTVIAEEGNWTEEGLNLNYHCRIPENTENTEWIMLLQTHWKNYEICIDNEKIYRAVNEQTGACHLFSIQYPLWEKSQNSIFECMIGSEKMPMLLCMQNWPIVI